MCGQAQAGRLGNGEEGTVSQATPVKIMTDVKKYIVAAKTQQLLKKITVYGDVA